MKLIGFYLFDAIAKNLYDTHAATFASIVVPLYLDTYFQVDPSTKNKMEEMLLTWRTAGPDHTEIFGPNVQHDLQTAIWGNQVNPSRAQVLAELQFTLGQMERALQSNPYDKTPHSHIHVLQQLRRLVERGVSQEELRQILAQLRQLARSALPPPIQRPPLRPPVPTYYAQPPPFPPQVPPQMPPYSQPPQVIKTEPPMEPSASQPVAPPVIAPDNIANLFSSLVSAGLISASATPSGATPTKADDVPLQVEDEKEVKATSVRDYRQAVLSETINLTTVDLARAKPRIVEFLYNRQPSQCRQCGLRFPDTKSGKKDMETHLDMHFRQNRKADQNVGRGHSRSWFIGVEDWIQDISGDGKGKGRADGSGPLNAKAAAAAELAKRDADLRAQYVVVPPGEEAQVLSCPICKETLKSEFLEDDEDWVWKNAVRKDDKIYHATCHAEAMVSTSTLAARIRNEKAHSSRSATPETLPAPMTSVRSTPPPLTTIPRKSASKSPPRVSPESRVAGVKRKIGDHEDANEQEDVTGTPPFKKKTLSTTTAASSSTSS
ncbi:hypothetical protein NLJ89_g1743 [Agrocybe chaxingu]|uniref:CID domain-containing protein n=1 Tax=Agrocybe chaxingu TaxID=84603 RepID=A0A9W8MZG1_9AGAR|nr:hypothetical protein NLJ89_g1743 [Agrocybe chaxingu]